jgi:protein phosphatase
MKAWILIGPPGSGKSTWAKELAAKDVNIVRLCPDEFRAKFGWGEGDQSVSGKAFAATRKEMHTALANGKNVVIDACNMYKKTRKDFLDIAEEFDATTIAVVFEATKDTLIERNRIRGSMGGRVVPDNIIEKMISRYECPTTKEFDYVQFIYLDRMENPSHLGCFDITI